MPGICRTRKESTFLQNIGLLYVIINFIRSRINLLDLIVGNMASNNEGQGSGDCDDVYRAADEFFSLTDESASSGGGREHTHEHAASAMYEHQHPTYPISVGCQVG